MVTIKLQKPPLKSHVIKVEPDFSGVSSNLFGQNYEDSSNGKIIKIITTRSKKPTRPDLTADLDSTDTDYLIGKGIIESKPFYLYFSKSQNVNEARWVNAADLRKNCKASLIRRTLFEGRLNIDLKNQTSKTRPYIDTEYIEKYLAKQRKVQRPIRVKAQELTSRFFYDFEVLKLKMKGIYDICDPSLLIIKKQTPKNVLRINHDLEQEASPPKNKKMGQKTVIKVEDDQVKENMSIEKPSQKSIDQSNKKSTNESNEKLFSFKQSIDKMKVKNTTNRQSKPDVSIDNDKNNGYLSFSSSFESSFESQKSISFSQRSDFTKQEVTNVKYIGRIKEKEGNYENLYKFSLLYHPDFYSTMNIIKEDEFLRNAFLKFAEPLYEQYKK